MEDIAKAQSPEREDPIKDLNIQEHKKCRVCDGFAGTNVCTNVSHVQEKEIINCDFYKSIVKLDLQKFNIRFVNYWKDPTKSHSFKSHSFKSHSFKPQFLNLLMLTAMCH